MRYIKIIFLLLLHLTTTDAFTTPWYLNAIQQTALSYQNKCRLINAVQTLKKATCITRSVLSSHEYKDIMNELAEKRLAIKNAYLTQEKNILQALRKSLHFTQEQWSDCLKVIANVKQLTPQESHVYHDPAIPQELCTMLTTLLHAHNIDLSHINLEYRPVSDNPQLFAQTVNSLAYSYCPHNTCFIQEPKLKQTIILYENIINQPQSHQLAILAHEVEHICKKDGLDFIVIEKYLQHYHQKDRSYFENSKEFQHLKIMCEAQAEICAALKNPEAAQALVDLRSKKFYPNHLYETHYHDLVEINNVWKIEQFIKNIINLTITSHQAD